MDDNPIDNQEQPTLQINNTRADSNQGQVSEKREDGFRRYEEVYPPSQKTSDVSPGMNAKQFPLRRDFAPDEEQGEDSSDVSPRELHQSKPAGTGIQKKGRSEVIYKVSLVLVAVSLLVAILTYFL